MPGDDVDHLPPDMEPTPADVFALVGHPIRAEIIWMLGHASDLELSFGEARSQLDTDVEPSQLHYHLQQLVGHFVEKTDNGYRLRAPGIRLCLALRTGTFDHGQDQLSIETAIACHVCQGPVEALFDQTGVVVIVCTDCKHRHGSDFLEIPREAFESAAGEFSFPHFRTYMTLKTLFLARGVCPSCANPLTPAFHTGEEHPHKVCIHHSCDLCGLLWTLPVGRVLLADPELIAFCHDHGVDLLSTPHWELEFAATDKYVTVRATDPWEVALEVTFDDDTLELVVDEDLNVIERHRRGSATIERTLAGSTTGGAGATSIKNAHGNRVGVPDITACLESLRRHRWPNGVTCPYCDSTDTIKEGTTSKDTQRYRCHTCDSIFNDLTGTIFAGHRFPLPEMFYIINEMEDKTPKQIAQDLNRSYDSVLDFVHEIKDRSRKDSGFDLFEVCQMT